MLATLRRKPTQTPITMRELNLREHQRSRPFTLSGSEWSALTRLAKVAVEPAEGTADAYF